jgi:hypothetical protein
VYQHHIIDDPDTVYGTSACFRVVVDIDDDIDQVVTCDDSAVGMISTPRPGLTIYLNVLPPL